MREHIRWMIRRDMSEVMNISRQCYGPCAEWDEWDFISHLRQRNCIGMVIETDDKVVGFMLYELSKRHLSVVHFGVDPNYRRRGLGTQLLRKLIGKLDPSRRSRLDINVYQDCFEMLLLCESCGFRIVGQRDDLYELRYLNLMSVEERIQIEERHRRAIYT